MQAWTLIDPAPRAIADRGSRSGRPPVSSACAERHVPLQPGEPFRAYRDTLGLLEAGLHSLNSAAYARGAVAFRTEHAATRD